MHVTLSFAGQEPLLKYLLPYELGEDLSSIPCFGTDIQALSTFHLYASTGWIRSMGQSLEKVCLSAIPCPSGWAVRYTLTVRAEIIEARRIVCVRANTYRPILSASPFSFCAYPENLRTCLPRTNLLIRTCVQDEPIEECRSSYSSAY